jgi:hypothetical protein
MVANSSPPAPVGDLYHPPTPLPAMSPGSLIWAEKVRQPPLNPPGTIWRFLYHSRSRTGTDIAVSAFAIVPVVPAAAGGRRPIYAWAHGTQGQAASGQIGGCAACPEHSRAGPERYRLATASLTPAVVIG